MRKEFAYNVGLLMVYKFVLEVLYVRCIYWLHRDAGWFDGPYDANLTIFGYVLALGAYAAIIFLFRDTLAKPLREYRFSETILFVLLLLSVIPGLAMCGVGAFGWEYQCRFLLYWLLFFFLARVVLGLRLPSLPIAAELLLRVKRRLHFLLGMVFLLSVVFVFFRYGEGRFFTFGLQSAEVYATRLHWSKISVPFPLNYVMANVTVVFSFLLLYALKQGRYGWAGIVVAVWYMEFSCGANKASLFSALACALVYATRSWLSVRRMLYAALATVVAAMAFQVFRGNVYILSFLVREMFATNLLSYCYSDFFSSHVSVLQGILDGAPVDRRTVPFLIGAQYLNAPECHANNGLLGDALMMAGDLGILAGPVLWMVYLLLLDKAGNHLDWWIKLGTSVYWVTVMQNSSFATSLLSHGGVAMIVLAYLCSDEEKTQKSLLAKQTST